MLQAGKRNEKKRNDGEDNNEFARTSGNYQGRIKASRKTHSCCKTLCKSAARGHWLPHWAQKGGLGSSWMFNCKQMSPAERHTLARLRPHTSGQGDARRKHVSPLMKHSWRPFPSPSPSVTRRPRASHSRRLTTPSSGSQKRKHLRFSGQSPRLPGVSAAAGKRSGIRDYFNWR